MGISKPADKATYQTGQNTATRENHLLKTLRKDWQLYVLLIPIIFFFFTWRYLPMQGILISFKNYKIQDGVMGSDFAGFIYFIELFTGPSSGEFWRAFRNTFMLNVYALLFAFPAPIILALLFSEIRNVFYRTSVQTLSYLPNFISNVIITTLIILLTANTHGTVGVVTKLCQFVGLIGEEAQLLYEPVYFRQVFIISDIWVRAGYDSIVYFAAIMGIPPSNYEAARVDGATKLDQIRYITLPGINTTFTIMLILRIGQMLQVAFEKVLLLYNAQTYEIADVLSTYVFRVGVGDFHNVAVSPSLATAAGLFESIIGMVLVIGANFISRKISDTSVF
ncbi:MAG: sugar ABC transporter permease [Chitinispirillia bacterium]|jgi:putative aldouronate transport system permease protein